MTDESVVKGLSNEGWTTYGIYVIQEVMSRSIARRLIVDENSVALIFLWCILRWEKSVATAALEHLGTDLWRLQQELDVMLEKTVDPRRFETLLEQGAFQSLALPAVQSVLSQALQESRQLGHDYTGTEHLLLALLRSQNRDLSSFLSPRGIDYATIKEAVRAIL